jgi:hypothetical protein
MPFVTQPHREKPDLTIPGDACFVYYKGMMDKWRAERRWTTAHNIFEEIVQKVVRVPRLASILDISAHFLAFLVFFIKHVMKYEDEKETENGTI